METQTDQKHASALNAELAFNAIQCALDIGIHEYIVCPSARNAALASWLYSDPRFKIYSWYEERSAAFFGLGKAKTLRSPIAIVTTSGTAVGELLPAVMEAFYSGLPLLLITADRPRRFKMTGAPQSAEQIGIFGPYCIWNGDFALDEKIDLSSWDLSAPAHLNLRFEEPITEKVFNRSFIFSQKHFPFKLFVNCTPLMQNWIQNVNYPFVIVGALVNKEIPNVKKFLINLKAPVYLEATSGLREDPELQSFRVNFPDSILKASRKANYPIDGILRLGGVPTLRLWRDLEEMEGRIKLCSISSIPFPGISWGGFFHASLEHLHIHECTPKGKEWIENDRIARKEMIDILEQEPLSEPSMLYQLSLKIPEGAFVYLGNSLPIREWDLCAGKRCFTYAANRGLNGIDGQISTFLGMCRPDQENWAIIGDLTALYDLAALWILPQMEGMNIRIVIINNKGGKIFSRLFKNSQFQNLHNLDFASLAQFWKISYEKWEKVPTIFSNTPQLLIELSPNEDSSQRFWQKYDQM